jgi:hypothetical protein
VPAESVEHPVRREGECGVPLRRRAGDWFHLAILVFQNRIELKFCKMSFASSRIARARRRTSW